MPPSRVAATTGRTTRHSKRLATSNGQDVSPLRSLPAAGRKISNNTRASQRRLQVEPSPSTDGADDSASHRPSSRSQSIEEPESRSTSPPTEQQPVRRSTRVSRSASRSVSPAAARTRKTPLTATGARSRRKAAPSPGSELQVIAESPQKDLPGSFPEVASPEKRLPTTEHDVDETTPTTQTTAVKRRYESSPDNVGDSDISHVINSKKRSRSGKYNPSQKAHSFATQDVVETASPNTTPLTHMTSTTPTPTAMTIADNAQQVTADAENAVGATNDAVTPQQSAGGFFSRFSSFLSRSAGPTLKSIADQTSPTTFAESETPPHILAILESPVAGPTLNSTTTPVIFTAPRPAPKSEPRYTGAWEAYAHNRPKKALFRDLPASARRIKDGDDYFELSDHEDNPVGLFSTSKNRAVLNKYKNKSKAKNGRSLSKSTPNKSQESTETTNSDPSMPISVNACTNASISPSINASPNTPSPSLFNSSLTTHIKASADASFIDTTNIIVIPADSTSEKMLITDPAIIAIMRSIATWTQDKPSNRLPDGEQMTAILDEFAHQKSVHETAMAESITTPSPMKGVASPAASTSSQHTNTLRPSSAGKSASEKSPALQFDCVYEKLSNLGGSTTTSDDDLFVMSGALPIASANGDYQSDEENLQSSSPFINSPVSDKQPPEQTATDTTTPTPARGFFFSAASLVKDVVTSPFKVFGSHTDSNSNTATTNNLIKSPEDLVMTDAPPLIEILSTPTPLDNRHGNRRGSRNFRPALRMPRSALKGSRLRHSSDEEGEPRRGVTWSEKEQDNKSFDPSPSKGHMNKGRSPNRRRPSSDSIGELDRHHSERNASRVARAEKEQDQESFEPSSAQNENGKRELSPGKTFRAPDPWGSDSSSDEEEDAVEDAVEDAEEEEEEEEDLTTATTMNNFLSLEELPADREEAMALITALEEVNPEKCYRFCREMSERLEKQKAAAKSARQRALDNQDWDEIRKKMTGFEKFYNGALHVQARLAHQPKSYLSPVSERSERSRASMSPFKRTPNNVFTAAESSSPAAPAQAAEPRDENLYTPRYGRTADGGFCVPESPSTGGSSTKSDGRRSPRKQASQSTLNAAPSLPRPAQPVFTAAPSSLLSAPSASIAAPAATQSATPASNAGSVSTQSAPTASTSAPSSSLSAPAPANAGPSPLQSLSSEARDLNRTRQAGNDGSRVDGGSAPLQELPQTPLRQPRSTPVPESLTKYQPSVSSNLRAVRNISPVIIDPFNLATNIAFAAADAAPPPPLISLFPLNYTTPVKNV